MNSHCFHHKDYFKFIRYASIFLTIFLFALEGLSQCFDIKTIENITKTELDTSKTIKQKLIFFYALKAKADSCKATGDSLYVRILENISDYEFQQKNYITGLSYALLSLKLNHPSQKAFSKTLQVRNYSLLAHYYDQMQLLNKALAYYDTTISVSNFPGVISYVINSRLYKAYIYFRIGDFQKGVEESTIGLNLSSVIKDSISYLRFLNQRIQSLFYQEKLQQADEDANLATQLAVKFKQPFQLASVYKMRALIAARKQNFSLAEEFFKRLIKERTITQRFDVVAADYNDFGNFYRDSTHEYTKAKNCYAKALDYAKKEADSAYLGMIYVNLTKTLFYENKYKEAESSYLKQMKYLRLSQENNFLQNPLAREISLGGNKLVIIALLQDKTEILLTEYKKNNRKEYLEATLITSLLTDSVLTQSRREQTGEQSKLYWRNRTRKFYSNAIEACFLANNAEAAFFFFEKSRAALLSDHLNTINAETYLPVTESDSLEKLQINIIEQEQRILSMRTSTFESNINETRLLQAKEILENYTKYLDKKYPIYYQYKYADKVPTIKELQSFLVKSNQSFVHYYMDDAVTYILAITPSSTLFQKLSVKQFDRNTLLQFLQLCSNKQALNNNYPSYIQLSNNIYRSVFQPLHLPKGRTIICSDNIVIPFEALYTDSDGKHFLINDYSFSYVYSARFLMKKFDNIIATANFIGFAPVSFRDNLNVSQLKNADEAIHAAASYYQNNKSFTHENASRSNFFRYAPSYSVVSIFSHAAADTTANEPVLYMQDSLIYLSELQRLNKPAIQLVILSACQTNVGRAATGEGIYSLARGFATAGIPSVAATLWKADEQTIYAISDKFNEYLSGGMNKDEALQKAKLYFVQTNSNNGKILPYYWANMILIGNTEAIKLTSTTNNYWWWILGSFVVLLSLFFIIRIKKAQKKQVT